MQLSCTACPAVARPPPPHHPPPHPTTPPPATYLRACCRIWSSSKVVCGRADLLTGICPCCGMEGKGACVYMSTWRSHEMQWKRCSSCLRIPAASSSPSAPGSICFRRRANARSWRSSSSLIGPNSSRSSLPSMSPDIWSRAFFHSSSWRGKRGGDSAVSSASQQREFD